MADSGLVSRRGPGTRAGSPPSGTRRPPSGPASMALRSCCTAAALLPAVSRRQHLPATWPAAGAFRAAEHGGIVTGWSLRLRRRVGRISRTRAGAGTEVFELKMSCVRKYRDEHGLRSGFGVCLGDGHVACEVLVSGTRGSGTLHIQTLGPWGGGSSGGFMRRQGPQDTRSGTRCPSPF